MAIHENSHLGRLLDNEHYFGAHGALLLSRRHVDLIRENESADQFLVTAINHLRVICAAMAFCAHGTLLQKMRMLPLACSIDTWSNIIFCSLREKDNDCDLAVDEYHVLMSANGGILQLLKKMQLDTVLRKTKQHIYTNMIDAYNFIAIKANGEASAYVPCYQNDRSPAGHYLVLAEALLFTLSMNDLYAYPQAADSCDARTRIWRYCLDNEKFVDMPTRKNICRMLVTVGHPVIAQEIAARVGLVDPLQRSSLRFA